MPQLLFVDACVRGAESRSRMLAERFLSSYAAANPDTAILHRDLMRDRLEPQYPEVLACRDALAAAGKLDDPLFADAWQFARADRLLQNGRTEKQQGAEIKIITQASFLIVYDRSLLAVAVF